MPIFESEAPQTRAQKRRRWILAAIIVVAGLSFSVWAAIDCAHLAFGYVASYTFAEIYFLACGLGLIGSLLMIYWRTRSTGIALLSTGVLMYLTFLGCIGILKTFDKVAWEHEPPSVAFGPDQRASLVIYYRPGTTDRQIEDFVEHKLENYPSRVHDGTDFPEFVTEYSALLPSQANGFNGSSLTFQQGAHGPAVESFIANVQSDPRVARIFRDAIPNAIHLSKEEQAPMHSDHEH